VSVLQSGRSRTMQKLHRVDEQLEQEWDRIAVATGASPFVRPGWIRAWMAAFRGSRDIDVLLTEVDGRLAGVMPVLAGRHTLRSPTNSETPEFAPVTSGPEAAKRLAAELLATSSGIVDLHAMSVADAQILQRVADRRGVGGLTKSLRQSPYVDVGGDSRAFEAGLSRNRRQGLKRLRNRLAERGTVTFDMHDGRHDLAELLRDGFRLEARAWKRAGGTAILSNPMTTAFYTAVAEWAAEEGILRLAFLRLDGQPIAFCYNLQQGSTLYFMKTGIDDDFAKVGPGVVLTSDLIDHAFREPDVTVLDLLGENETYKMDFASGVKEQVRLRLFPNPRTGRLERAAVSTAVEVGDRLRERLPEPVRLRLASLRDRMRG
jgi:CelD/BcsL family acetyltransferase involved in cellulose biosynthesis